MLKIDNYTVEEEKSIQELKRKTIQDLTPRLEKDETLFYRFLKARNFNIKAAETMLRKHLADIDFYDIRDITESYVPPEHYTTYLPASFIGYDKEGASVEYIDVGGADIKGIVYSCEFKLFIRFAAFIIEKNIDRMTDQALKLGKPVTQFSAIMNMDKFSLFQATFKQGIEYLLECLRIFQDNYPERIKTVYVINSSFYFSIAFSILKKVLAGELLSKIYVFGRTDWQEVLLNDIDENILPAFLGGKRTDPDGNPLCNSFVVHGKKIPENFYLKNQISRDFSKEEGVKKLIVARYSCSEIEIIVHETKTIIEWEFQTKGADIIFGLYYRTNDKNNKDVEELIPKKRIDDGDQPVSGVYICESKGIYIIKFDNSYSWLYSKEIYYKIRSIKPHEHNYEII